MARKYKLRLGDGTILAVDDQGLRTWVDRGVAEEGAMVQPAGSRSWEPLRQFLSASRPSSGAPGAEGSIRLAPIGDREEETEEEDVYQGEAGFSIVSTLWLWLKRLVLLTALLMAAGTAAVYSPVWLPRFTEFGVALFTEIDKRVHPPPPSAPSADEQKQQRHSEARQAATEQLPHLDGHTIDRVMSSSLFEVLDPPEVFRRAYGAVQRGRPSLTEEEAREMKTLEAALLAALRPDERELLREYERAHARRVTMPFEDRQALGLVARATLALPSPERERLRLLFAKAVAAGLADLGPPMGNR